MTGTDRSRQGPPGPGPAVVLVEPQLGENIGFVARAMMNAGLSDLRLVRPRDGWPNDKAVAASSGADSVLAGARLHGSVEAAVAGLNRVYATTARGREMLKPVVTARRAASEMRAAVAGGEACGVLFGPERTGLLNDHLTLADALLTIPLDPGFSSLNLGQAAMIVAYEWYQSGDETAERALPPSRYPPARKSDMLAFFEHFERELDDCGFLYDPLKRPTMVLNLRALFERAEMTEQEVRTMRGILVALAAGRRRPKRRD